MYPAVYRREPRVADEYIGKQWQGGIGSFRHNEKDKGTPDYVVVSISSALYLTVDGFRN